MRLLSLSDAGKEIARQHNLRQPVPAWRIRRLFELGILPPAERVGRNRVVTESELPIIAVALSERGWLPASTPEAAAV
jgi:hypothetical protein